MEDEGYFQAEAEYAQKEAFARHEFYEDLNAQIASIDAEISQVETHLQSLLEKREALANTKW